MVTFGEIKHKKEVESAFQLQHFDEKILILANHLTVKKKSSIENVETPFLALTFI